ncbi:beta-lactamase [Arthroderma uncinatum]|uniref:beta-lactamase n=1 Tax=Arthroderma uncinatum TaxID=74035 RepID=UPI00144AC0AF|nr:beta-lactamase [Arthroderma uncinatum]KAF3480748.1 beta-lactamase [Arthroderma uncinatum]
MDPAQIIERICSANGSKFHAAAFKVSDHEGKLLHSTTHGTLKVDGSGAPVTEDSMFWIASMAKLVTAVAVMVAVEKGLVGLDDDAGAILPELAEPDIIVGFDEEDNGMISLYACGFVYLAVNASVRRWAEYHNHTATTDVTSRDTYRLPLAFEPGESWGYGPGIDWAGFIVEKVSNQKLEEFMQENIFRKLGLTATTFHPESHPEFETRRVELSQRAPDGTLSSIPIPYTIPAKDDMGGGENVLRRESVDAILSPQLESNEELNAIRNRGPEQMSRMINPGKVIDMGLSTCINLDQVPNARSPGSVSWAGAANAFWWLDMKAGICGTLFLHSFPPFDSSALDMLDELEAAVCSPGGIGHSLALEFQRNGLRVFATARSKDTLADLEEKGIETMSLVVDEEKSVLACLDELKSILGEGKGLDVLVNNADTLRVELEPFGVNVVTIITGGVESRIARTPRTLAPDSIYQPIRSEYNRRVQHSQDKATPNEVSMALDMAVETESEEMGMGWE